MCWARQPTSKATVALRGRAALGKQVRDGCPECNELGYRGRTGIYELLMITDKVRRLALAKSDAGAIRNAAIEDGTALKVVRDEHETAVENWKVWGVPTFCANDQGVFVRLMTRSPKGSDPQESQRTIERVVDLLTGWTDLNEFKHTYIPR